MKLMTLIIPILLIPALSSAAEPAKDCVKCHQNETPGIVGQWKHSKHSKNSVGCFTCHQAEAGAPGAFQHHGSLIKIIVSPKDCATCHEDAVKQFESSHHADAGKIMGSLDNVLAEVVEGHTVINEKGEKVRSSAAAVSGCLQCHGSEVKVLPNGKFDPATWPNTGIGRLNPDGSKGSCAACHLRHDFSIAQARMPENCGRCHLGPDHPQMEIYTESKHGIAFAANRSRYEPLMAKEDWIPGKHYEQGPTCSSCHMGATRTLKATHDVGERISWTLRPAVSEKIDEAARKFGHKNIKPWEKRRTDMQLVCRSCHGEGWVSNFYTQYDNLVNLYNDKFGKPATELYKLAGAKGLIPTDTQFTQKIDFTYYFLWHHEGRRARHGAAMMGPDYTQWHGMLEVADRFYPQFVPELKEIITQGKSEGGPKKDGAREVEKRLDEILNSDMHRWSIGKMSAEEKAVRKKASDEFKKRYAQ